jgi:2-phospho-L-lactate/phosphoenolpyruvate guanylyltransferase
MPGLNGDNSNGLSTAAVIPVKRFSSAHDRLSETVSAADRQRLAEALFLDLLSKIRRSRTIDQVVVVTADENAARNARWLGHEVILQAEDGGHSQAAAAGARAAAEGGFERVAMLPIDCPLLDPRELDAHLGRTPRAALIVPDRHGTGTNALVLSPPDAFAPAFGPDSCARHVSRARAAGVGFGVEPIESLAADLDTPEDLTRLRDALIVNPQPALRTAQVLWELGAEPATPAPA